jgi:HAD superfamily hydrolase (TIGR01549 family)
MEMLLKHAILFDFWQTLVVDTRERAAIVHRQKLVSEFLAARGIRPPENLEDGFEEARRRFFGIYKSEHRTATLIERLNWIFGHLGLSFPEEELGELEEGVAAAGLLLHPEPTPHVIEVLERLSDQYPLGIVSDTGYTPGRYLRQLLDQHGMLGRFTAFSFSDETGHAKPHPETFLSALRQLGVEAESAMHCGDLPDHDIVGANELGITSVLYTGYYRAELDGVVPDHIISDWRELPALAAQVFS